MTNTLPNVPRYRVEKTGRGFWPYCVRAGDGTREVFVGHQKQCAVVAAELETAFEDGKFVSCISPSPAGVDGLELKRYWHNPKLGFCELDPKYFDDEPGYVAYGDAQAIIDGLRGENERIRLNIAEYNEAISCYQSERDQQAQRIGELEGLLREVRNGLSCENLHHKKSEQHAFDEPCKVLGRIDAALSAGKDGE